MPRLIAIDYGLKRTGLAWTDPMRIIATAVGSFDTPVLEKKLKELVTQEVVDAFVLGYPTQADGSDTHSTPAVRAFELRLQQLFPDKPVYRWDERYTSKMAGEAMRTGGASKKQRQDKHLINAVAAVIILQEYLAENG